MPNLGPLELRLIAIVVVSAIGFVWASVLLGWLLLHIFKRTVLQLKKLWIKPK